MKRLFAILLFSAVASAQSIVFNWNTGNPVCSPTVKVSCQSSQAISDTTSGTPVLLSGTIDPAAMTYTTTNTASVTPGQHTFSLVEVGKDSAGNSAQSAPATVSVTVPAPPVVPLNPPNGFTATVSKQ